jgi:hypothetical protein
LQTLALEVDKSHSEQTELGSVPEFVAELSVSLNPANVQIDITTCSSAERRVYESRLLTTRSKVTQPKPQGIGTTLGNTLGEDLLLSVFRLDNLLLG